MNLFPGKKRMAIGTLAAVFLLFAASSLQAAEENFDATIEIIANLTIIELTPLDFGTVGKPSDGTAPTTFTLNLDNTVTPAGGDGFAVDGTSTAGQYQITGNNDVNVDVEAFIDGNFGAGVDLTSLNVDGNGMTSVATLDGTGTTTVTVGGEVEVTDAATEGTHTADIRLTVNYQ